MMPPAPAASASSNDNCEVLEEPEFKVLEEPLNVAPL